MLELIRAEGLYRRSRDTLPVVLPEHVHLNSSLELTHRIASIADEKLANDIVILDMRDVVSYTDYFVICSGRNPRQTQTIAEELARAAEDGGRARPRGPTASQSGDWILLDFLDVVVHVFTPEARSYYRLESLWGEVPARRTLADERVFTLDEAEALLDGSIRDLAGRMVEIAREMKPLRTRWQRIVIAIGSNGGGLEKRDAEQAAREAGAALGRVGSTVGRSPRHGVQVKDIERGLVDFPAVMDGRPALLCWHVGEARIGFWHGEDEGFAGRRRPL